MHKKMGITEEHNITVMADEDFHSAANILVFVAQAKRDASNGKATWEVTDQI